MKASDLQSTVDDVLSEQEITNPSGDRKVVRDGNKYDIWKKQDGKWTLLTSSAAGRDLRRAGIDPEDEEVKKYLKGLTMRESRDTDEEAIANKIVAKMGRKVKKGQSCEVGIRFKNKDGKEEEDFEFDLEVLEDGPIQDVMFRMVDTSNSKERQLSDIASKIYRWAEDVEAEDGGDPPGVAGIIVK